MALLGPHVDNRHGTLHFDHWSSIFFPVATELSCIYNSSQQLLASVPASGLNPMDNSRSPTMSTSVQVEPVMERRYEGVGRCKCSFWFAVAHDILGVFIMLVGVFGGLVIHDLFIYAGAIVIFLSLIWWVFWYSGNIDVPPEELEDDVGMMKLKKRGLGRVVRRVSDRLTNGIRSSFRKNGRWSNSRPANTDVSLSTIYDSTMASSSKHLVRETLSI